MKYKLKSFVGCKMSKSNKHTPGPWKFHHEDGFNKIKSDAVETGFKDLALVYGGGRFQDANANARLIAAAPDLLEALERLAADYADRVTKTQWDQTASLLFNDVRRAINKAKGGVM